MTAPTLSLREAAKMALDALENSIDDVLNEYEISKAMYQNMPTRQGRVAGLKAGVDAHDVAIESLRAALALPEPEPVTDAVRVNLIECLREHAKFACIEGNEKRMVLQAADMLSLPESAPVAWNISYTNANGEARKVTHGHNAIGDYRMFDPHAISTPLYASPQPAPIERQPLTDEQARTALGLERLPPLSVMRDVRKIEAAHGIGAA